METTASNLRKLTQTEPSFVQGLPVGHTNLVSETEEIVQRRYPENGTRCSQELL